MKSLRVSRGKVANGDSQDRYPFISTSAGTPMFLAHPATKRGEARASKSVAPSRHRTPRQDHSRKTTLAARSAKTKRLSDLRGNISEQLPARLHCEECVAVLQVPSYDC